MKTIPLNRVECRVSSVETGRAARHPSRATLTAPKASLNSPPSTCNRFRAFTIVELLTVIAIIAILAAMLLPALSLAKIAAQKKQARLDEEHIVAAIEQYDSIYGRFPISPAAQAQAVKNAQAGENPDFTYGGVFQTPNNGSVSIGTYVSPPISSASYLATNSEVMAILLDLTNYPGGGSTINTNFQYNPQKTVFLNAKMVDTNQTLAGVAQQDLVYRDPWGNPYIISMDLNYDDLCRDAFYCSNTVSGPYNPGRFGLVSPTATATTQGNYDFQYRGKVMVWSAGPDGKVDPNAAANQGANKDNVISWQ